MTVLDASALIAGLVDEPARVDVEALLRGRPRPSISAVNLAEAVEWLVRIGRHSPGSVRDSIDWLLAEGLEVEPVWLPIARRAAALRSEHYHRVDLPVSLADCFCLATAMKLETDLATTDPALARLARQLGVDVIALPDSEGRRP